jgi:hypothetical protein
MATELDKLYYTVDADTQAFMRKMGAIGPAADEAGKKVTGTFKESEKAITATHGATSTATREFRALFDELSSGRTRMVPGTLAIIATRVFGIGGAALAAGAAIAAIPAAFALAAYQTEAAINRMNMALARTGYAAGASRSDLLNIANNLNASGIFSERGAMDTLSILAGRGNIGLANLPGAAAASRAYGQQTGLSEDKAAAAFEKILADPTKGAKELAESFKNITNAQEVEIRHLVAMGDTEDAQKVIIDAEIEAHKKLTEASGTVAERFRNIGDNLSRFWSWLGGLPTGGQPDSTGSLMRERLNLVADQMGRPTTDRAYHTDQARIAAIDQRMRELQGQEASAIAAGAKAKSNALDTQVQELIDRVDVAKKTTQDYSDAITLLKSAIASHPGAPQNAEDMKMLDAYQWALANHSSPEQAPGMEWKTKAAHPDEVAEEMSKRLNSVYSDSQKELTSATTKSIADWVKERQGKGNGAEALIAQGKENDAAARSNDLLALEISLMGQEATVREKALADQRTRNELTQKGIELGSTEAREAIANAEKQVDLNKQLADTQKNQQNVLSVMHDGMQMVDTIFSHINQGAKGLKSLIPDLEQEMISLMEKLVILNPLENALTGAATGTAGTLPSAFGSGGGGLISALGNGLASLFGGGDALSGVNITAPNYSAFRLGGAWSGGVRFAASGMVLGGSTVFGTGSGPVIGGEMGKDTEALMPLARGPDGSLGIKAHGAQNRNGAVQVHQHITIHPDVSAVARGEIVKALPAIQSSAMVAFRQAAVRGFNPSQN